MTHGENGKKRQFNELVTFRIMNKNTFKRFVHIHGFMITTELTFVHIFIPLHKTLLFITGLNRIFIYCTRTPVLVAAF